MTPGPERVNEHLHPEGEGAHPAQARALGVTPSPDERAGDPLVAGVFHPPGRAVAHELVEDRRGRGPAHGCSLPGSRHFFLRNQ